MLQTVIHCRSFAFAPRISSIESVLPSANAVTTLSLFCVKVPVLSEHITEHPPSVSTDLSLRITTPFLLIFCTPIAIIIVTTAGKPSGIAATAIATEVIKFFKIPSSRTNMPIMKITAVTASTNAEIILPSLSRLFSRGVLPCFPH